MSELGVIIEEVTSEVLETMFFADPTVMATAAAVDQHVSAMASFSGTRSGAMTLCISDTAARMLAANFMGADEEAVSPDEVEGVVKEMANILCGGLLERLNGDGRFTISSPTLIEPSLVGEMHGTMQTRRSFDLEIGTLAVGVSISEQSEAS